MGSEMCIRDRDSFSVLPRSLLWSCTGKMVGVGLFCFHLFFFVRPRHNEASDPGMGGEGSKRVNLSFFAIPFCLLFFSVFLYFFSPPPFLIYPLFTSVPPRFSSSLCFALSVHTSDMNIQRGSSPSVFYPTRVQTG